MEARSLSSFYRSFNQTDFFIKIVAGLLAAHFIVVNDQEETLIQLICQAEYYYAMASSFIMAIIIIELISFANYYLDRKFDWSKVPYLRAKWQLVLGVVLPMLLLYVMVAIYFNANGYAMDETVYMDSYFYFDLVMVLLWNCYCYIRKIAGESIVNSRRIKAQELEDAKEQHRMELQDACDEPLTEEVLAIKKSLKDFAASIVYIYAYEKANYAILKNGSKMLWPHTIKATMERLSKTSFFCATRSYIVKHSNIKSAKGTSSRRMLLILIKPKNEKIYVSKGKTHEFLEWYERRV